MNEPIDFFALVKEQEKTEKPQKEVKQTTEAKEEKQKLLSFDEQYQKVNDPQLKMLVDHLLTLDGMKEKMSHLDVSIDGMYQYCKKQAQKKAQGGFYFGIDNEELYGWGRHYYDECGKVA